MATRTCLPRPLHRSAALLLALLLTLASALVAVRPAAAVTTPFTVTWAKSANVTRSSTKSVFPWVAVDSNNKTHIIYSTDGGGLYYINNVGGGFSSPKLIVGSIGANKDPFYALAIGPNNTLHIAYSWIGRGNNIYYQQGTFSGGESTWGARQMISTGYKSFAAHLAVDGSNNAHIVWIDNRCGMYNVFYRMRENATGKLSGVLSPRNDCSSFQNRPQIAITSDGRAHIAFQRDKEIYYARWDGKGWMTQNISQSGGTNSLNPTLASDGKAVYVAWDEGVNGHDIQFRRSADGGSTWSNRIDFSNTSDFASFPSATWLPGSRRVLVAWSDGSYGSTPTDIWYREFNPETGLTTAPERIAAMGNDSLLPVVSGGPASAAMTWQDKNTGTWQIYNAGGTTGPAVTPCDGSMKLNGGAASTRSSSVSVAISTPASCDPLPDQMQISVDKPLADDTAKQTYSASLSVDIPASDVCQHTVYGRLFTKGVAGKPFSASIIVDDSVGARVQAINPFLPSNSPAASTDGGPRNGDARYTRSGRAFLSINAENECVGLKEYTVPGNSTQTITSELTTAYINILQSDLQGEKTFQVNVKDKLDNQAMYPSATQSFSLIYDTTPPVLDTATVSPTVTVTTAPTTTARLAASVPLTDTEPLTTTVSSIIVTLTLSDTYVTDNLYGQREGLDDDAAFWGVYLANSREPNPNPDSLVWSAVPVARPGARFSVEWSLFSGLGYGPTPGHAGDYYVFVKFVDGAGNVSSEGIQTGKIVLAPNYSVPSKQLGLIMR